MSPISYLAEMLLGLLDGHLVGGVHVVLLLHHVLLDEHLQVLMLLIHVHDDVFHVRVVPLVGGGEGLDDLIHHEGLGDAPLLFQQSQSREDLRGIAYPRVPSAFSCLSLLILLVDIYVLFWRQG